MLRTRFSLLFVMSSLLLVVPVPAEAEVGVRGDQLADRAPASSPELVPFVGSFQITATWGSPSGGYHADSTPAIDTAMPPGTPIYAAGSGTVTFTAVDDRNCNPDTFPGGVQGCLDAGYAGTRVHLAHPDGTSSRYVHLSGIASGIANGVTVGAGQLIGYSGNSGTSTGPHLHYEERNAAGAYVVPGDWTACDGSTVVTYDNLQGRKNQTIRNSGYECVGGAATLDADHDGVADNDDRCSSAPGPATNFGCPTESDFNGDGNDDVVVAVPAAAGRVSYQFGLSLGDGHFTLGTAVGMTDLPRPLASTMADINGDGRSDVVLATANAAGTVDYQFGLSLGDGHFTLGTAVGMTGQPVPLSVTAGDFNGDGNDDVVVAVPAGAGRVSYQFGLSLGDGHFSLGTAVGMTDLPRPLASTMADINGDGRSDVVLATANAAGTVDYQFGLSLGDGHFTLGTAVGLTGQSVPAEVVSDSPARVTQPPRSPRSVAASRRDRGATVRWLAPSDDGGSGVTSYRITALPGGSTTTANASARNATIRGLVNGRSYRFVVTATNVAGGSTSALTGSVVPAGRPGRVARPVVRTQGKRVTLTWRAAPANGAEVTHYVVRYDKRVKVVSGRTATFRTGRLKPGTHTFTVTARNSVGTGPKSLSVKVRIAR